MLKPYHNPPHLYLDKTIYFITGRTLKGVHYFNTDIKKQILADKLKEVIRRLEFILYAWVILENHYHLLLKTNLGKDLAKFVNLLHGGSSFELNKFEKIKGRQIWFNYWDWCIRNERDFNNHVDYAHYNVVKHGLAKRPEDYRFSSYLRFVKRGYYEIGWGYAEPENIKSLDYDKGM